MKKLAKIGIIFAIVLAAGCSLFATFDNMEYNHLNELTTLSELGTKKCLTWDDQKAIASELEVKMLYLSNYIKYASNNKNSEEILALLQPVVDGFVTRVREKEASETYCVSKLQIIALSSSRLQHAIGETK